MKTVGVIAHDMAEMAATYKDDTISNALARVSRKLEHLGKPFAEPLDETDKAVIKFYRSQRQSV